MGLASLFLGETNPFAQWATANHNTLAGIGAGLGSGATFGEGLGLAAQNLPQARRYDDAYATAQKEEKRRQDQINQTVEFLRNSAPDIAQAVDSGLPVTEGWSEYLRRQRPDASALTSDMRNFQFAQDHPEFADFLKQGRGSSPLFGRTIYTGRDANGNIVPLQAGADGSLMQTQLPEGVTFDPGAMAGARAGAMVDAKTAAAARAALPNAEQTLSVTRQAIDNLRNDRQGQSETFGNLGGLPIGIPNQMLPAWPGTPKANFQINVNQAAGQAFMQARQMLKGGGQITDYEGRRAEVAISKIEEAAARGDQKAFNDALDEFSDAVESGYQKLVAAAGGSYSTTPIPSIIGGGAPPASAGNAGDPLGIR